MKTSVKTEESREVDYTIDCASRLAGKYLTFRLASIDYGFEILKVKEIIGLMKIIRVPRTPDAIRGVINLRGRVIPVMDLRTKFNMETAEDTPESCVIVVDGNLNGRTIPMGVLVDSVSEVLDIAPGEIEDAPSFDAEVNTKFILGTAKAKGKVIILLDINKVLSSEDLTMIEKAGGY